MRDFLVEILTEELPPKTLKHLGESFKKGITDRLTQAELTFKEALFYATPRRLAVHVKGLVAKQKDALIERRGPALTAAFKEGNPTQACLGFARSLNITPQELITLKNDQGEWVGYQKKVKGKKVTELLPHIVQQSLHDLPVAKRMRWGNNTVEFVRPVHSVIMLYGDKIIPATILNLKTGRKTKGHRFMSKGDVTIANPETYLKTLMKKFVIADFETRRMTILREIESQGKAIIDDRLLEEVTGLVEWPVALRGEFNKKFLNVPKEALISSMQDHQRYFPIANKKGELSPYFITISNLKSKKPKQVIAGNERVISARLSDADFFFQTDKKISLQERLPLLKDILFQKKLGSLFDKTERLGILANYLAKKLNVDIQKMHTAALLSKTDLTTQLVNEFPELQGIAGFYYTSDPDIALALKEQYLPKFAGDAIPASIYGSILAIADRIDTLVGIFGIEQIPTGDKDPFGLRRASLGVLRILIEKKLDIDLFELLNIAVQSFGDRVNATNLSSQVFSYMLERLKQRYQEQNIVPAVFSAVSVLGIHKPYDIECRIQAVQSFKTLGASESLSIANKRVSNILNKYAEPILAREIDTTLFKDDAETILYKKINAQTERISSFAKQAKYTEILHSLADLREPVDQFFDKVLVMTDEKNLRENRLLLLKKLRGLFLEVADIAYLQ